MSQISETNGWWDLHLKKARGEQLSEQEEQVYAAEMARQDQAGPLRGDIEELRKLRGEASRLAQDNERMRERILQLEAAIRTAENGLGGETKRLLGVQE